MGPITKQLLDAIRESRQGGEEVTSITLYATAYGELFKEGSGLTGHNGECRTFDGIPIACHPHDPLTPDIAPFVLNPAK